MTINNTYTNSLRHFFNTFVNKTLPSVNSAIIVYTDEDGEVGIGTFTDGLLPTLGMLERAKYTIQQSMYLGLLPDEDNKKSEN